MRSRSRSEVSAALAAARVSHLLSPAAGGWVPPLDMEPQGEVSGARAVGPAGSSPVGSPEHEPEPADWLDESVGAPARPAAPGAAPAGWSHEAAHDVEDGSGGVEPTAATPAGFADRAARPQRSWTDVLPATLRGGRLDVSRGAVLGLLAVAVVAALVATLLLVRGRPAQVPVPQVLAAGSVLPGASTPPAGSVLPGASTPPAAPGQAAPASSAAPSEVVVSVVGKVAKPGLVRLPAGSRVDDALRAAGGAAPDVEPGSLNLARVLVDGEQVAVGIDPPPGVEPPGAAGPADPAAPPGAVRADGLLDLNRASVTDFDSLPGIGPVLAQRIVDWREANGPFTSVDQLREVTGIGEAKYADLEPKVAV